MTGKWTPIIFAFLLSVTRFGKIRHFGKILLVFANFLKVYLIFGKIVNLL